MHADQPERFTWLFDKSKEGRPRECWKPEILTELGRVADEARFFDIAEILCREKPKTKAGVEFIRYWRTNT